jgi:hypothetical protein
MGALPRGSNSPTSNESEAEKVAFKTPSLCDVVMMCLICITGV